MVLVKISLKAWLYFQCKHVCVQTPFESCPLCCRSKAFNMLGEDASLLDASSLYTVCWESSHFLCFFLLLYVLLVLVQLLVNGLSPHIQLYFMVEQSSGLPTSGYAIAYSFHLLNSTGLP